MKDIKNFIIIVGIPAYNTSKHIEPIIKNAKKWCTDVLVCDDGSTDDTAKIAKQAGAIVIQHESNMGYGKAIRTLFEESLKRNAEILITLDSDGQHDVNDIPKLIRPILIGKADITIGSRYLEEESVKKIPKYRSFGIKTITKFVQASSYNDLTDSQSGYRAYNNYALSKLDLYEDGMALSTEILLRAKENNLQIHEVPIKVDYNENSSTQSPIKHGLSVLTSVVQFISLKHPLSFYGVTGVVLLLVGIFFMNEALTLFSETRYVSTPLIVLSMGTAIVGIVLFATGVILYTLTALLRGKIKNN